MSKNKLAVIGGECELRDPGNFYYFTDSGRSSLRLILRSLPKDSRFLLPDFLCKVIIDVFKQEKRIFSFYKVNSNLSIDLSTLRQKEFDVLYAIDYFGQRFDRLGSVIDDSKILIEDAVFLPEFNRPKDINNWIAFNSLRKIIPAADGSLIKSTMKLNDNIITAGQARFVEYKYKAKAIKYDFLKQVKKNREEDYLRLFKKGEEILNREKLIYAPSAQSLWFIASYFKNLEADRNTRNRNYHLLSQWLDDYALKIKTDFYSFCVLNVPQRDKLRNFLFRSKIFLPIHWPRPNDLGNAIYDNIISIPVDSRYKARDLKNAALLIRRFLRRKDNFK